jgi:hypothetical protein
MAVHPAIGVIAHWVFSLTSTSQVALPAAVRKSAIIKMYLATGQREEENPQISQMTQIKK